MTLTFERYEEEFQIVTSQIQNHLGVAQNDEEDTPPFSKLSRCEELIQKMRIEAKQQRNPHKEDLLSRLELYIVQLHTLQTHCLASESDELITKLPEQQKPRQLFSDLASQLVWVSDARENSQAEPASIYDFSARFFPKNGVKENKEQSENGKTVGAVGKSSLSEPKINGFSTWFKPPFAWSSRPLVNDEDCWNADDCHDESTEKENNDKT